MAFTEISAPHRQRQQELLSTDNLPERHVVMSVLRRAASLIGLKPPALATLDALLSCLPPKRHHHTVFASNETLVARRNGVTDRTIRRHVALLIEAGLMVRRDSANRKRFVKRSRSEGLCLRFGFDLSPLYARFAELAELAAQADALGERLALLKTRLRALSARRLAADPDDALASEMLRALRRKLSESDCEMLLARLGQPCEHILETDVAAPQMSASDSQNVRHHQSSNKELIDKTDPIDVPDVLDACPEATLYAQAPITTDRDLVRHGRLLAPMLGIDPTIYAKAERTAGAGCAAIATLSILQLGDKVRSAGAYFYRLLLGKPEDRFDPSALLRHVRNVSPPRTTSAAQTQDQAFSVVRGQSSGAGISLQTC
ncbi:replication initiation protein RepC [Salipiger sp. 1_MG-2023]|uniref:replication initiation protein RepC n=1 Tax=Salipiger sp. 1_MG-2023 TaxID=3062665 RepID=UPI0026E3ADAF|nr:replication initiation protein RepC [Salipiger sp. 1_MG-2023]MDO6585059.1 replication initiation protein RepC [Salipiger sp. 1_MG-2023]